ATSLLTQAVLEDRKILVCGCEADARLAAHVAAGFRTPEGSGPALPALAFCSDTPSGDTQLWRDLKTLSRDGDILLCIDTHAGAEFAQYCVKFADQRNLVAISMSEDLGLEGIACIVLPVNEQDLRSELILMASHCLQEQIKHILVGE
ncbi:MAG: phosphoheptose isomerase, partial [Congregibacter sp.]|nr:phosphoheptose isomerase [Congregibacter sp.]